VTLLAGTETRLVITVQPSNVGLLNAISPAPRVEFRDSGNNLVPLDGRVVTASIASGNGTLLLPPLSTSSGGVAVFNSIVFLLDGPGNGNHTLQFSSAGVIPAVSVTFKVN
jgi:hypothetical protein